MTILSNEEKKQGLAKLAGRAVDDADLQYFRDKLIKGLQRGQTARALEKAFKQLALMEDTSVIYRECRSGEDDSVK